MKTKISNMKILFTLYFALSFCTEIYAEGDSSEVKRGSFPFMAFLYYPDDSVVDSNGARFLRGAVLIQPDWLITSAFGSSSSPEDNGFPRKTLLARAGAITIDTNITLNEDEDEQEREIIQIVRPYNHSATQWWYADISLMRTLVPFNLTSAVSVTMLNSRLDVTDKTCSILIFTKIDIFNNTDDKRLIEINVDLLAPSALNCGQYFHENYMTCAIDTDDNRSIIYDPNFCQDNRGGPLVCEGDVVAIQTYIENNCKQPHLYQLLSPWENLITCATDEKCHEEQCSNTCDIINKDPVMPKATLPNIETTSKEITVSIEPTTKNDEITINNITFEPTPDLESLVLTTTPTENNTVETTTEEVTTVETTTEEESVSLNLTSISFITIESEMTTKPVEEITIITEASVTPNVTQDATSEQISKSSDQDVLIMPVRKPKVEAVRAPNKHEPGRRREPERYSRKSSSNFAQTTALNHNIFFGYIFYFGMFNVKCYLMKQ